MKILRASLLHTRPDPSAERGFSLEFMADAALLIDDQGLILEKDEASLLIGRRPDVSVQDLRPHLLVPGFIDTHIHFPQMDMIGACSPSLLPWLETYTFPEEMRFRGADPLIKFQARAFTKELASEGTTLAVVYSSSDFGTTQSLFEAFAGCGLRGIIGKVSMDQHGPEELLVSAEQDLRETEALLGTWHGRDGRLFVALTPRFAPNCSPELMRGLAAFAAQDKSVYIQTHYAENQAEIDWVRQLYPKALDYLDVYDSFGLLGEKTILAHCIHTSLREQEQMRAKQIVVSHCPTSNMFLGSGLMPFSHYQQEGLKLSLGTDVGAGTSFSIWQTMAEAYKVAQLRGEPVSGTELLYAATLGAARSLGFASVGCLESGYEADFQLLDLARKSSLLRRWNRCETDLDRLNALIFGADSRLVQKVWVAGREIELNP